MDDLRERVGRELDRLQPSAGGLERTLRLVRRRQRNGRLAAATIGIVLAGALVGGFWTVLRQGSGHEPLATSSPGGKASSPANGLNPKVVQVTVRPLREGLEQMPTGVMAFGDEEAAVCTQDFEWTLTDGTRLRGTADSDSKNAIPVCRPRTTALRVAAGTPINVVGNSTTSLRVERTVAPLYAGLVTVAVEARWADGWATFIVPLNVVVTASSPTHVALDCAMADQIPFEAPTGGRILPGGAAYIVGNLRGVRDDDIVEQMTFAPGGTQWDGMWQVVRDGSVIATVNWPALSGVACRGSAVGGV